MLLSGSIQNHCFHSLPLSPPCPGSNTLIWMLCIWHWQNVLDFSVFVDYLVFNILMVQPVYTTFLDVPRTYVIIVVSTVSVIICVQSHDNTKGVELCKHLVNVSIMLSYVPVSPFSVYTLRRRNTHVGTRLWRRAVGLRYPVPMCCNLLVTVGVGLFVYSH